jgi:hypothetical protein
MSPAFEVLLMFRALRSWLTSSARPARPARRASLRLEALDARVVPAALVWNGPDGGVWSNPSNWYTPNGTPANAVPGAGDTLYFGELNGANTSSVDDISGLNLNEIIQSNTYTGSLAVDADLTTGTITTYGPVTVAAGMGGDGGDAGPDPAITTGTYTLYGSLTLMAGPPNGTANLTATLLDMPAAGAVLNTNDGYVAMQVGTTMAAPGAVWHVIYGNVAYTGNLNTFQGEIDVTTGSLNVIGSVQGGAGFTVNLTNDAVFQQSGGTGAMQLGNVNIYGAGNLIESTAPTGVVEGGTGTMTDYGYAEVPDLTIEAVNFKNDGTITYTSAGQEIYDEGNFNQFSTGTMNMVVDSSGPPSQFIVSGNVELTGAMNVTGSVAGGSSSTLIVANGGRSGDFDSFSAPAAPAGFVQTNGWVGNNYVLVYSAA